MIIDSYVNTMLSGFLPESVELALHSDEPVIGSNLNELSGGDYVRKTIEFESAANNRIVSNTNAVTFENLPASVISYISICDSSDGSIVCYDEFAPNLNVVSGDILEIAVGDLQITIN